MTKTKTFFLSLILALISLLFFTASFAADVQTIEFGTTESSDTFQVAENTNSDIVQIIGRDVPADIVTYQLVDEFILNQYDVPQPVPQETQFVVVQKPAEDVEPIIVIQPTVTEIVSEESFLLYATQKNLSLESCHAYTEVMTVQNTGDIESTYWIMANAFIANRLTLSKQNFTLSPGDSTTLTLTLTLECGLEKETSYDFTLETDTLTQTFSRELSIYTQNNLLFSIPELNTSSCSCENESIAFAITNNGTHADNYSISIGQHTNSLYQSATSVFLQPGETYDGEIVTAFCDEFGNRDFAVTVETEYSEYTATQDVSHVVNACAGNMLTVPDEIQVCRFSDSDFSFTLTNDANTANEYILSLNSEADIFDFETTYLSLNASASQELNVPTKTRELAAGTYNVTITSRETFSQTSSSQNIRLVVENCYDYNTATVRTDYDICPVVEQIPIVIENTGLVEENYHFVYDINKNFVDAISLSQTDLTLNPGENETIYVSVDGTNFSSWYTVPLTFTTTINSTQYRENILALDLHPKSKKQCYGLTVSPTRLKSLNTSGVDEIYEVTFTHTGLRRNTYNISLDGPNWLTMETAQVTFSPGQSAVLNMTRLGNESIVNDTYNLDITLGTEGYTQTETLSLSHNVKPIWPYVLAGFVILILLILILIFVPFYIIIIVLFLIGLVVGVLFLNPLQYIDGGIPFFTEDNMSESNETQLDSFDIRLKDKSFSTYVISQNETAQKHTILVKNHGDTKQKLSFEFVGPPWMDIDLSKATLSPNESVELNVFSSPNESVKKQIYKPTITVVTQNNVSETFTLKVNHESISVWVYVFIGAIILVILILLFFLLPFWWALAIILLLLVCIVGFLFIPFGLIGDYFAVPQSNETQVNRTEYVNETEFANEDVVVVENETADPRLAELTSFLDDQENSSDGSKLVFIDENSSYRLPLHASFSDPDNDSLTYAVLANNISNMTLSIENETLLIVPDSDYIGHQTIKITASDGDLVATSPDIHLVVGPKWLLAGYRGDSLFSIYIVAIIVLLFIIAIVILDLKRLSRPQKKKPVKKRKK